MLKISLLECACSFFNMCEISHVLLFMSVRVGFHGQVQQAFISEFQQLSSQAFEGYFQWISKAGELNIHSFCSKDPHCWIPKCKIRLVVKPVPSGINVVCPSILSLNGPPPNPFTPTPIVPCAQFFNGIISLTAHVIFITSHIYKFKCFRYKYIFVAECVQEHFWNFFSRDTLIWHIL